MARKAPAGLRALRRTAAMAAATSAMAIFLALGSVPSGPAAAQEQSRPGGFAPDQIQGIEQIVRDYLFAHPEVLIESLTAYQQRQRVAEEQLRQQALIDSRAALTEDPDTPVVGNPEGDVAIVEFFDYRCQYCRRVAGTIKKAVEQDGNMMFTSSKASYGRYPLYLGSIVSSALLSIQPRHTSAPGPLSLWWIA